MVEEVQDFKVCLPFVHESLGMKTSKFIVEYYVTNSSRLFSIMSPRFHKKPACHDGYCHDCQIAMSSMHVM